MKQKQSNGSTESYKGCVSSSQVSLLAACLEEPVSAKTAVEVALEAEEQLYDRCECLSAVVFIKSSPILYACKHPLICIHHMQVQL